MKKDLCGQKFGYLTVLEKTGKRKGSQPIYLCKCDLCGQIVEQTSNHLSKSTKSCGCLYYNKEYDNLINKKFGKLTVVSEIEKSKNRERMFKCKCDCGNIKDISGHNLIYNHVKSCGCSRKNKEYDDILSKKFGDWTVLEEVGKNKSKQRIFKCRCKCGNIKIVDGPSLLYNRSKNCGCKKKTSQ